MFRPCTDNTGRHGRGEIEWIADGSTHSPTFRSSEFPYTMYGMFFVNFQKRGRYWVGADHACFIGPVVERHFDFRHSLRRDCW